MSAIQFCTTPKVDLPNYSFIFINMETLVKEMKISAEKITRNRQMLLNPKFEKSLKPQCQSHPRALMLSLLKVLPPPQWISLQFFATNTREPPLGSFVSLVFWARAP